MTYKSAKLLETASDVAIVDSALSHQEKIIVKLNKSCHRTA